MVSVRARDRRMQTVFQAGLPPEQRGKGAPRVYREHELLQEERLTVKQNRDR
jgi:hypothetical protein